MGITVIDLFNDILTVSGDLQNFLQQCNVVPSNELPGMIIQGLLVILTSVTGVNNLSLIELSSKCWSNISLTPGEVILLESLKNRIEMDSIIQTFRPMISVVFLKHVNISLRARGDHLS